MEHYAELERIAYEARRVVAARRRGETGLSERSRDFNAMLNQRLDDAVAALDRSEGYEWVIKTAPDGNDYVVSTPFETGTWFSQRLDQELLQSGDAAAVAEHGRMYLGVLMSALTVGEYHRYSAEFNQWVAAHQDHVSP